MSKKQASSNSSSSAGSFLLGAAAASAIIGVGAAIYNNLKSPEEPQPQARQSRQNPRRQNYSQRSDQKQCTICLDDFRENVAYTRMPDCGHKFHVTCIKNWIDRHHQGGEMHCPNCRKPFSDK